MVFRLISTMGENVTAVVRLDDHATMGGYRYNTQLERTLPLAFEGTVEYEGYPSRTWPVSGNDPTAVLHFHAINRKPFGKVVSRDYVCKVPMGNGDVIVLFTRTYYNLSLPPPPLSPPPPPASPPPPSPPSSLPWFIDVFSRYERQPH